MAKTPAADHLFMVREDAEELSEEKAQVFHNATAKALYVCKSSRPDIQTVVSFLTTRVRALDEDDWKQLVCLMGYLKATLMLALTLRDNGKGPHWWIDAAFGVHPNMRAHTGGTMSMGTGSILSKSSKQKLNTLSSTEAELVGT